MMGYIRRYDNQLYQNSYENACDCLYYGMGSKAWEDCGVDAEKRREIWAVAWYDLGDGCEENGKRSIESIVAEVLN